VQTDCGSGCLHVLTAERWRRLLHVQDTIEALRAVLRRLPSGHTPAGLTSEMTPCSSHTVSCSSSISFQGRTKLPLFCQKTKS
jgi:hypothetical protein